MKAVLQYLVTVLQHLVKITILFTTIINNIPFGSSDKQSTLWEIILSTSKGGVTCDLAIKGANIAYSMEEITTKHYTINFLHGFLFRPVKSP